METPAQFRMILCQCEHSKEPMLLTYSRNRGYFEPVTGQSAEPIVGRVTHWEYYER